MRFSWWFLPGYLWSLPGTVLGLILAVWYWPRQWRISEGCIEAVAGDRIFGKPGAQTHGWLIYYRDEKARDRQGLRVHERVHVVQGFVGGVFYMLAYGLHFLWNFAKNRFRDWDSAYRAIWAEKQAYRIQAEFNQGKRPDAWGSNP
jgi:hypothetical protein